METEAPTTAPDAIGADGDAHPAPLQAPRNPRGCRAEAQAMNAIDRETADAF
jgi:hypothetical protein